MADDKKNDNGTGPVDEKKKGDEGAQSTPTPPANDDLGFPAETPVAEMTAEQQVAYWKHQARKHEKRAKDRSDYDEVKAELDQLKQEQMTEAEKAVQEARKEGEEAAAEKWSTKMARAALSGALAGRGFQPDEIEDKLSYVDFTKFVDDNGEVDSDTVQRYLNDIAPQQDDNGSWPDIGQGSRGDTRNKRTGGSVDAGRQLRRERQKQRNAS